MLLLTKAIFAIMIGFLFSAILGLILVPIFRKMRIGQKISIFVGEAHRKKEGTPTFGGLIFIIPTIVATIGAVYFYAIGTTLVILALIALIYIWCSCRN